ncbi:unnamed protein product, partial [Didymodactylos carnosus]
ICYSNIGEIYRKLSDYDQALVYTNKAITIYRENVHNNHLDLAIMYNNLAIIYKMKCDQINALINFNNALDIYILYHSKSINHSDIAILYFNIGVLQGEQDNYELALENFNKSIKIYIQIYSDYHPMIAQVSNNIGNIYIRKGLYKQAMTFYENALKIQLYCLNDDHSDNLAQTYQNLGTAYYYDNDNKQALIYYRKSYEIYFSTKNDTNLEMIKDLLCCDNEERIEELNNDLEQLRLFSESMPVQYLNLASMYANNALIYSNQNYDRLAMIYCQKALDIRQQFLSFNHIQIAFTYNLIASIHNKLKDEYDIAIQLLDKAYDIFLTNNFDQHSSIGSVYYNYGIAYKKKFNYHMALNYFKKSLIIRKIFLSDDNRFVKECRENINEIQNQHQENE